MSRFSELTKIRHQVVRRTLSTAPALHRRHLERTARKASASYEPELRLVAAALTAETELVDVGANLGIYSMQAVLLGKEVCAFEPNPSLALQLQRCLPEAKVVASAVSDVGGIAQLAIPQDGRFAVHSRASIVEGVNAGHQVTTVTAPVVTLDACIQSDNFVLKIDVEGNEGAVLAGAGDAVRRGAQAAIVESEERHAEGSPVQTIAWFADAGFDSWMVRKPNVLEPAQLYSPDIHQSTDDRTRLANGDHPSDRYVNNFLFVRRDGFLSASTLAAAAGFEMRP